MNPCDSYSLIQQGQPAVQSLSNHGTDHLVARCHGKGQRRGAALDFIEFGMTDSAGANLDEYFPGGR